MSNTSAAGPLYRQYSRSSSAGSAIENLPPRTLTRVAREVRDLHKSPPEGIKLVVDGEGTGSLAEIVVSCMNSIDPGSGVMMEVCQIVSCVSFAAFPLKNST
jgi:hypothetical protein